MWMKIQYLMDRISGHVIIIIIMDIFKIIPKLLCARLFFLNNKKVFLLFGNVFIEAENFTIVMRQTNSVHCSEVFLCLHFLHARYR